MTDILSILAAVSPNVSDLSHFPQRPNPTPKINNIDPLFLGAYTKPKEENKTKNYMISCKPNVAKNIKVLGISKYW